MGSRYYTIDASDLNKVLEVVGSRDWSYLSPSKVLNKTPTEAIIPFFNRPKKESSFVGTVFKSWKDKYCLHVKVINENSN